MKRLDLFEGRWCIKCEKRAEWKGRMREKRSLKSSKRVPETWSWTTRPTLTGIPRRQIKKSMWDFIKENSCQ